MPTRGLQCMCMQSLSGFLLVSSPSCHAPWAKDSLDNFKQFLGSAELASSENETTNQIALFAIRNSIT